MALKLHPSADDRIVVYLPSDESLADNNDDAALVDYLKTGDDSALVIPDDATRVTIAPLTPSAARYAVREAGGLSKAALDASRALTDALATAREANTAEDGTVDEAAARRLAMGDLDSDAMAETEAFNDRYAVLMCELGVTIISDWPDIKTAKRGAHRRYPAATVERLPLETRAEIAAHVGRVSALGVEGKARSGSPSGAPVTSPTSGPATTAAQPGDETAAAAAVPSAGVC